MDEIMDEVTSPSTLPTDELLRGFLQDVEKSIKVEIPMQLKRLLFVNGYKDLKVIAQITEEDIKAMENFAKETLSTLLKCKLQRDEYFGIFANDMKQFKILNGHKKVLQIIANYYEIDFKLVTSTCPCEDNTKIQTLTKPNKTPKISVAQKTDLSEERNSLMRSVFHWIEGKCPEEKWPRIQENMNGIDIAPVCDKNGNISAHITCYCSAGQIAVYKLAKNEKFQKRWILSNFHRHFKKHFIETKETKKEMKKRVGDKQTSIPRSIQSYFIPFNKRHVPSPEANSGADERVLDIVEDKPQDIRSEVRSSHSEAADCSMVCGGGSSWQLDFHSQKEIIPNTMEDQQISTKGVYKISSQISQNPPESSSKIVIISDDVIHPGSILNHRTSSNNDFVSNLTNSSDNHSDNNELPQVTATGFSKPKLVSKWADEKYSRNQRKKRLRDRTSEQTDEYQSKITEYFPYLRRIEDFMAGNPNIAEQFRESLGENLLHYNSETQHLEDTSDGTEYKSAQTTNNLLQVLLDISIKNALKTPNHNTYDDVIKKFALYIFYTGGRLLYETLQANLTSIFPSISCLNRYARETSSQYSEGVFYFEELNKFLEDRHLPKQIWISEDGTRITGKVEYDSKEDKILGFVLPLKDGIPVTNSFMATSAMEIQSYFQNSTKSNYAYAIMAQPLRENAPSFCLAVFGTDNKFTFKDVQSRWKYIGEKAQQFGITVMGYSSDGDTRLLKAMRLNSLLPMSSTKLLNNWPWYLMDFKDSKAEHEVSYVQDSVHIATKMRTRLLKPDIKLPIGEYYVSVNHLQSLIDTVSKDQHLLTASDLMSEDKMNYLAAQKMCSPRVVQLLIDTVPDSQATVMFLKIMYFSTTALLEKDLSVSTRLYYLWYSIFCLRIWRQWILVHPSYTIADNFLSSNCYLCIELNGHSLLRLIRHYRDQNVSPESFTPYLFSSQACEKLFRVTRSMTSTYSTIVNFSIKEILHRIDRIQMINNIMNDLTSDRTGSSEGSRDDVDERVSRCGFIFPREKKRSLPQSANVYSNFQYTTDEEIKAVVERAMSDAIRDTGAMGVTVDKNSVHTLSIPLKHKDMAEDIVKYPDSEEMDNEIDDALMMNVHDNDSLYNKKARILDDIEIQYFQERNDALDEIHADLLKLSNCVSFGQHLQIRDFSGKKTIADHRFLQVIVNEKQYLIKKSSLCWLLDEKGGRVSSDRVRRFIQSKCTSASTSASTDKPEDKPRPVNKNNTRTRSTASKKVSNQTRPRKKSKTKPRTKRSVRKLGIKQQLPLKIESDCLSESETASSDYDLCDDDSLDDVDVCLEKNDHVSEQQNCDEPCAVCQEHGKTETWYRCTSCGQWAHSQCTAADSPHDYVCDYCTASALASAKVSALV